MVQAPSAVFRAGSKSPIRTSILFGLALAILHGYLASIYIDHPPLYDEMYHMLAAESWRISGELRILDGEYRRAPLFTKLVGLSAYVCGPSLECARGLTLVASALLVFFVTVFAGTLMRPAVGFVAGLLVALNPGVIAMSQYVRFYSLHALVFFLFAVIVFILIAYRRRLSPGKSLALACLAAILFLFAHHLQVLTQIGLFAVIVGAAAMLVPSVFISLRGQKAWTALFAAGLATAAIVAVFAVDIEGKIQLLRSGPYWAQGLENQYLFYHHMLRRWYPALWPVMALLAVLAIAQWPRLSVYVLAVFLVSFVLLSIAGQKHERYIVYALPFLFVPMAAGIVTGLRLILRFVRHSFTRHTGWQTDGQVFRVAVIMITMGALAFAATADPIVRGHARMLTSSDYVSLFGGYDRVADWPAAAEKIKILAKQYPTVLSSSGIKAAYYLGDFSFELNSSVMRETDTRNEFGLDRRTGRQVVSSADSVRRIVDECGPVLVIIEGRHTYSEDLLAALDALGDRVMVAANLWVWRIEPTNVIRDGFNTFQADQTEMNCRPITVSQVPQHSEWRTSSR